MRINNARHAAILRKSSENHYRAHQRTAYAERMTISSQSEGLSASRLIAAEVRAEAARQGMSHRRLGIQMGVSYAWVNRRCSVGADVEISFEDAERLATALGVSVTQLLDPWLRAWRDSNPQPSDLVPAPVLRLVRPSPVTDIRRTQPRAPRPAPSITRTRRHLTPVGVLDGVAS